MIWKLTAIPKRAAPRVERLSQVFQQASFFNADLYVNMRAARAQGNQARAIILVLWPTWIIWRLYEQNVTAMAPPMARIQFTPRLSISRKAPTREMKR